MSDENKLLYSGNIEIEYGQFYFEVADENSDEEEDEYLDPESAFENQENGICGAAQHGKVFFVTGIQNGVISISVELYNSTPPIDESFGEIVEVSFQRDKNTISLCEWAHQETHQLDLPTGSYRIRYSIDGMEQDYGDDDDWELPLPNQRHLIQIWASEKDKDTILKVTSDTAKYWHKEWGSLK